MDKYICIHGHFYQPPRENAWLETVELQDSAYPFHDWNERITVECYNPNTAARILNNEGVIKKIINNYSKMSFNFGPTLLSWLEENNHKTYEAILEADKISQESFSGHGSAIAQVYNHIIMPLANQRDKETQVIWGIKDFEHRFKRFPEGMWLAETAADTETLEVLATHGIKFTILAPRQVKAFRKIGASDWTEVADVNTFNTRVPYKCILPSGKEIFAFIYDGDLSQSVAFNGLLNNGKEFAQKLYSGFNEDESIQLVNIATDGESYGHHHKHGDMALAYCLDYIENNKDADLTNYGEYLEKYPVDMEIMIQENSSWSCVHGVGRWKENCGCNTGGHPDWNQEWRKPLRVYLDRLRDQLVEIFEKEADGLIEDPWKARNEYIQVILNRRNSLDQFLKRYKVDPKRRTKALRMLEMQRHAILMFTSCGWFFDDVSGIETVQILQYACRAIQLAEQESNQSLENDFINNMREARSNVPEFQNAAEVYKKYVIPTRLNLERVGMHYSVSSIFEDIPDTLPVFNYIAHSDFLERREAGAHRLALGQSKVQSRVTLSENHFSFAVLYLGQQNIIGNISLDMSPEIFSEMYERLITSFDTSNLGQMIGIMQEYFGPEKYNLWHLFKDEKRRVLKMIMRQSLSQVESSFRRIYNHDYQLINSLKADDIPVPNAYKMTLQYVVNSDLRNTLDRDLIDLDELERIADELEKWGLSVDDSLSLEKHASLTIYKALGRVRKYYNDNERLQRMNKFFEYMDRYKLQPNLYRSQNLYFEMSNDTDLLKKTSVSWKKEFLNLGKHLGIKV